MEFKIGDKIRCVDVGISRYLILGKEYNVIRVFQNRDREWFVEITNDCGNKVGGNYYANRFELAYNPIIDGR